MFNTEEGHQHFLTTEKDGKSKDVNHHNTDETMKETLNDIKPNTKTDGNVKGTNKDFQMINATREVQKPINTQKKKRKTGNKRKKTITATENELHPVCSIVHQWKQNDPFLVKNNS